MVESVLGIEVPTREEMRSVEASGQMYHDNGAVIMNARVISKNDTTGLRLISVTFILVQGKLITLRYGDPAPFRRFVTRAEHEIAHLSSGAAVMVGLLETIIDRAAEILEMVGDDLESLSSDIFARDSSASAARSNSDLRPLMQRVGANGDLATRVRESLLSLARVIPFLRAEKSLTLGDDLESRLETAARDVASLLDHDNYLASTVTFLLDATLGLINIQQNGIIKIFSVAAVIFMPPTLVASIYGMNFTIIPELHWTYGYPYALMLMLCSAILPFYYFKRRGGSETAAERTMIAFANTCIAIAQTPKKLEKIALLAAYLRTLGDDDLAAATRFFTGDPFAAADGRSLAVGGRTLIAAAKRAWGAGDDALSAGYRASGDLGAALGPLVRPVMDLGLFRETLTPASLKAHFDEIAAASGPSAQRRRQHVLERILGACTDPLEATYVIKIVTGDLRIGLKAGLVADALAAAFERDPAVVRRAAAFAGDIGAVALAARHDTLAAIAPGYHAPIAFMLATPIPYGETYPDLAESAWIAEDKYDGIRLQAHVTPDRVSLFSRTLSDVSAAFPEVVAALRSRPGSFALDGELIAERDGAVLPFRFLQARLARKVVDPELARDIPVRYVAFDVLARDGDSLIDLPLVERRGVLAELLAGSDPGHVSVAPWQTLAATADAGSVNTRFAAARERGHEGLVFKRSDAPYAPGRRGKWWLKLKRELATLDAVVVGVERGHGRRANVLSDYTFAVRDGAELVVIGKAYSGLTDAEIAEMTVWFETHRLEPAAAREAYARLELKRREIVVEPTIVVEIAFDIIQESALHASGFSLRFPRIVRLRPDKPAAEADTLDRVRTIYAEMLSREGLAPGTPT